MFEHASKEAGTVVTELTRALDMDSVGILKTAGCTCTVPDRAAFKAALAGTETPFDGKLWPAGLVERIRGLPENT